MPHRTRPRRASCASGRDTASELRKVLREVEGLLTHAQTSSSSPRHSGRLLGALLVIRGFVVQSELDYALQMQATTGKRLGEIVVELGFVTEDVVVELIAEQLRIAVFDATVNTVDVDIARQVSEADARRLCAIPIGRARGSVVVAVAEPTRPGLVAELVKRVHSPVRLCAATHEMIANLITDAHGNASCLGAGD